MLFGDDRGQPADIADDFRAAGLGHLLAVSGQNVAFLLALAGPLLRRLRIDARLATTLGLVLFFAMLTRFEPSVLRACAMASVAATTSAVGRHMSPLRALGLAVTILVLVDPLVVHTVAFQLSVAACLAIVVAAPPLAAGLPGPRALTDSVAVTVAAQIGVAPLLLRSFGAVPLAAVPANVLAAPAAGLVMVWGLPAGLLAGTIGGLAPVLHIPTRALLWWVATIAAATTRADLGTIGLAGTVAVALCAVALMVRRRLPRVSARAAGTCVGALVVAIVTIGVRAPPPVVGYTEPAYGSELWRSRDAVVLILREGADVSRVLEGLRAARVRSLDGLAAAPGVEPRTVDALRRRYPGVTLLTPSASDEHRRWCVDDVLVDARRGLLSARLTARGGCDAAR
jgi:competence protein ComEC